MLFSFCLQPERVEMVRNYILVDLHTSELAPRLFLTFFLLEKKKARGLNMRATAAAARPEKNERGGRLRRV